MKRRGDSAGCPRSRDVSEAEPRSEPKDAFRPRAHTAPCLLNKLHGRGGGSGAKRSRPEVWGRGVQTPQTGGDLVPETRLLPLPGQQRGIKFILSRLQNRTMRNDGLSFKHENSSLTHKISINKSLIEQASTSPHTGRTNASGRDGVTGTGFTIPPAPAN